MEDRDYFTFRNPRIRAWLLGTGGATCLLAVMAPPSLWLCGVGGVLLVGGMLAHSARTAQWFSSQNWEPSLNWFEGWAASTGVLLLILPLLVLIAMARWSI